MTTRLSQKTQIDAGVTCHSRKKTKPSSCFLLTQPNTGLRKETEGWKRKARPHILSAVGHNLCPFSLPMRPVMAEATEDGTETVPQSEAVCALYSCVVLFSLNGVELNILFLKLNRLLRAQIKWGAFPFFPDFWGRLISSEWSIPV